MSDAPQIRVVISATAAELRSALKGAGRDVDSLSAQIKAVPDRLNIDVRAQTAGAISQLQELSLQAEAVPDLVTIVASADIAPAMAKLALLEAQTAAASRDVRISASGGGGGIAPPPVVVSPGGGGQDRRNFIYGSGIIPGTAGALTVGSLAGFGTEHVVAILGGLIGSALSAAAGAATLAAGGGGALAAGGGSDLAVVKSTVTQTKALAQAWQQVGAAQQAALPFQAQFASQAKIVANPAVLADYQKLLTAIKEHGINSTQAATADTNLSKAVHSVANPQLTAAFSAWQSQLSGVSSATAGLSAQMQAFGNTAGTQAQLGLAKATSALGDFWNQQTSAARVAAVSVLQQVVTLGHDYVPLVASAAQQNLSIISQDLKPLFAWLEGPQGKGIFLNLEQNFKNNLPTAIDAFTQAVQFLLRYISLASNYTGGLTQGLDSLFTRLNSLSDAQINQEISKLVDDFRIWEQFIKLLILDVYTLFHQDLGTGNSIVQTLTTMLEKLHEWELSTSGQGQIHTIFSVHLQEIRALLSLVSPLASVLSHFYLAVAPPLVAAVTGIAQAIAWVLTELDKLGPVVQTLLGLAVLALKFQFLRDALTGVATALGVMAKSSTDVKLAEATLGQQADAIAAALGRQALAADGASAAYDRLALSETGALRAGEMVTGGGLILPVGTRSVAPTAAAGASTAGAAVEGGIIASIAGPLKMALGGLIAGSIVQSLIPGLRQGFAATVGGGAVGGLIGSIFGSWGALIGSTIGATFGPTIAHLLGSLFDGTDYGKRFADGFVSQFQSIVPQKLLAAEHQALDQAYNQLKTAQQNAATTAANEARGPIAQNAQAFTGVPATTQAQVTAAYAHLGALAGQDFVKNLQQVPFPTEPIFLSDFKTELAQLPPQSRAKAAEAMIAFAQQLQDSGKLPKGSVAAVIKGIEKEFPGLTSVLQKAGDSAGHALGQVSSETAKALGGIAADFGILPKIGAGIGQLASDLKNKFGPMVSTVSSEWDRLKALLHNPLVPKVEKDQALKAMQDLRAQTDQQLAAMVGNTKTQMQNLSGALASGGQSALNAFTAPAQQLVSNMTALWQSGVLKTSTFMSELQSVTSTGWTQINSSVQAKLQAQEAALGAAYAHNEISAQTYHSRLIAAQNEANTTEKAQLDTFVTQMLSAMSSSGQLSGEGAAAIISAMDKALKPLGAATIPVPTVVAGGGVTLNGHGNPGFEKGGLVQFGRSGEGGRDSIPLNFGGQDIVVGPGEVGAVLTRHHVADLNARLADQGGLSGYFERNKRANYMAGGGLLPGSLSLPTSSASGSTGSGSGYVYPFPGLGWGRTDQGVDFSGSGPLYAIGPGKVVGGSWGWSPGGGGLVYQLTGGPKAGSNVYYMENVSPSVATGAQISAGQAIASVAGVLEAGWANSSASGPLTPYNGAPDGTPMPGGINFRAFLQALQSGGALPAGVSGTGSSLGAVAAKVWAALTAPKVTGSGAMADIMRAGLGKVTNAANAYGQKATQKWNAANAGAGASVGGVGPAAWMAAATQIAGQHGWDASQVQAWLGIERLEDGSFSLTATNPSSGAYGLAQFINGPGEYAQYGGNATTLTGQLTAMANYIAGRYGTPSAAYAYALAHHSYARGGLLRSMAQGGMLSDQHDSHTRAFRVNASSETSGGQGAFGFSPGSHGKYGYSILSGSGLSTDPGPYGIALGPNAPWQPPSELLFRRGTHGPFKGSLQDKGAGDNSRPTIGLYENLIRDLGGQVNSDLSGVEIERADGKWFTALRGTPIAQFGPFAQKSGGKGGKGSQHKHPSHHKKPPDTNPRKGHPGAAQWPKPPLPELPGPKKISDQLRFLNDHLAQGSTNPLGLQYLSEQMAYWPSIWGVQNPTAYGIISSPGQAIITTDPKTGQPVSPHVDQGDLAQARDWLGQEIGWQAQIVRDIKEAIAVSTALAPEVRSQIEKRQDEIKHVRSQIKKNLEAAKDLQAKITHNTKWISRTRKLLGAVPTGTGPSQGAGATKPDSAKIAKYKAHIKALTEQSHDWAGQIEHLTDENEKLGGKSTTSPQATGGKIGQVGHQISKLKNVLGQVADPSGQWSPDALAGVTGVGGQLGSETVTLATLRSELAALSGPNIATQLKIAKSSAGQGSSSQLAGLLAQELQTTETDLAVSQSQFATLKGFEPSVIGRLVGSFQSGIDFVDRTGLAIVHRGEKITPDPEGPAGSQLATVHTSGGPQEIIITMATNEVPLVKVIDARIGEKALPIVREQSGRRARVMAGVTRRP